MQRAVYQRQEIPDLKCNWSPSPMRSGFVFYKLKLSGFWLAAKDNNGAVSLYELGIVTSKILTERTPYF